MTTHNSTLAPLLALFIVSCVGNDAANTDEVEDSGTSSGNDDATESTGVDESDEFTEGADASTDTSATDSGEDTCGNGQVEPDEACDDGINDGSYGGCATDCMQLGGHCGDGETQPEYETCDDGRDNGTEACNMFCQVPGTVLVTQFETFDEDDPGVQGVRATVWNGRPTAAFSGWGSTSIWEIDPESLETFQLRSTNEGGFYFVSGALGLETGDLLLAGDGWSKAVRFDEQLQVQWTYTSVNGPNNGFVGVAPMAGGVMLGGRHIDNQPEYSAYWVAGLTNSGASLWDATEVVAGTDDIYGRDFRGIAENRGVFLTDLPGGSPGFRIYDPQGNIEGDRELPALVGSFRHLCPGENGFFLIGWQQMTLVGFDVAGESTFGTSFQPNGEGQVVGVACAARQDNSPVVAVSLLGESTTTLETIGFSGSLSTWHESVVIDGGSFIDPAVLLDEERARVSVFAGGQVDADTRWVYMKVIAI